VSGSLPATFTFKRLVMTRIRKINLNTDDLHKLKKHKSLRVDNYVISVDDIPIPQVKVFGFKI
jgi:hypothetical protein